MPEHRGHGVFLNLSPVETGKASSRPRLQDAATCCQSPREPVGAGTAEKEDLGEAEMLCGHWPGSREAGKLVVSLLFNVVGLEKRSCLNIHEGLVCLCGVLLKRQLP